MDFDLLKTEHAKDADFDKLVPKPRSIVPRKEIKILLLPRLREISELSPIFTDPDFTEVDVSDDRIMAAFIKALTPEELDQLKTITTEFVPRWQAVGLNERPQAGDIEYILKHS